MIFELLSNPLFPLLTMGIWVVVLNILVVKQNSSIINLNKTVKNLKQSFLEEDNKINENFSRFHKDLITMEREVNHHGAILARTVHQKQSTPSTPSTPFILDKKLRKFLTPKGKIKKKYQNNPSAQECYKKFHNL